MERLRGSRKPTVWKCPGLPGPLPYRSRPTFSHIPTDRCAVGRTGAGADGPAADSRQTHFGCVWLKIDSRAAKVSLENPPFRTWSKTRFFPATSPRKARRGTHSAATPRRGPARNRWGRPRPAAKADGPPRHPLRCGAPPGCTRCTPPPRAPTAPAFAWDRLSSYTHRPTRSRPHGAGGRWAGGRFPTNPLWVRLAKNRLTSSKSRPREPAFLDLVEIRRLGLVCPAACSLPPTALRTKAPTPDLHQGAYPRPAPSRLPPTYLAACPPTGPLRRRCPASAGACRAPPALPAARDQGARPRRRAGKSRKKKLDGWVRSVPYLAAHPPPPFAPRRLPPHLHRAAYPPPVRKTTKSKLGGPGEKGGGEPTEGSRAKERKIWVDAVEAGGSTVLQLEGTRLAG